MMKGKTMAETLTPHPEVAIRRKYAHFQRLMTSLMWECLIGKRQPIDGIEVIWLYRDDTGKPLTHELHLPKGTPENEVPIYNRYAKALYLVRKVELLAEIRRRLTELAAVQAEALALSGLKQPGKHLLYPKLLEDVHLLRYWHSLRYASHRYSKARLRVMLENILKDKREVTRTKYEGFGGVDPVLAARYAEIRQLEARLIELSGHQEKAYRVREPYHSVLVYAYDTKGNTFRVDVPNVGLIVSGKETQTIDMNLNKPYRKPDKRSFRPEPWLRVNGVEIYLESAWQAFRQESKR